MIVVVDHGMGNLQSVVRALSRVGGRPIVSSRVEDIERADKIVLPGVGSLLHGMEKLKRDHLLPALSRKVLTDGAPILGICLGQQMFGKWSEEGNAEGLGWVDGFSRRLRFDPSQPLRKIPHIGWNTVRFRPDCPLFQGVPADACFYFAHSYYLSCEDAENVAGTTEYGSTFVSAIHKGRIFGTQFHPEKSQANGLLVLRNFVHNC